MTVVISSGFVVSPDADNLDGNSPIIGYQNLVTVTNVAATTEDADHPVSNLANVSTRLFWRSSQASPVTDEYITILPLDTPEQVDYLAVARHNFGTNVSVVSVEGVDAEPGSPADWFELVSEALLPNDNPVIFRWEPQSLYGVRLRIQAPQADEPVSTFAAVVYVGKLLLLQRRIYVGHTPAPYGVRQQFSNQRSIAGDFLGRILLGETVETSVSMQNLTPDWYRANFEPFVQVAREAPFFFNWRPGDYQYESTFAWLTADIMPTNQQANGMMQVDMSMEGIVT